jgi:hypothetical protein
MAKPRLINGLPHDLVQSFFSTLRYWEKGYMSDWIVNAAQELKINKIRIDIINKTIDPKDIEIKPIIFNINELDKIIDKAITNAGLTRNFIKQAYFDIDIFNDRYLKCQTIIIAENEKKYQAKDYIEKSFEIFKVVKLTEFDRFRNWIEKKYFRIRFIFLTSVINRKFKYTKRLKI